MRRSSITSPTFRDSASASSLTAVPGTGGRGSNQKRTKENGGSSTSLSAPGDFLAKPDTHVVGDRAPLRDSSVTRHTSGNTNCPTTMTLASRMATGRFADLGHGKAAKATRSFRVERQRSTTRLNQLGEKRDTTQALNARIRVLEKAERRLKSRLLVQKESLKDSKADLQAAQYQGAILEERLDDAIAAQKAISVVLGRYRGWWLNEYYCLKVALQMIADPDEGVAAMRESSRARYLFHLASQSDSV